MDIMMNVGTNDRDHPNSSPLNSPSPRQQGSPLHPAQLHQQDSLEMAYKPMSPASPQHLERPLDDRLHNRRPSDEAAQILRKISSTGLGYSMVDKTMSLPIPPRHVSYPTESASFHEFSELLRQQMYFGTGLGDTGRMLTSALSDSFLPMIGQEDPFHPSEFSPHPMQLDERRGISPEDSLFPPLSQQDRHPSAPQLVSMLTTESKPDMMVPEDEFPARKRSWSMPANAPRPRMPAPQISISSPDDPLNAGEMCK